jgi:hypothetical protein
MFKFKNLRNLFIDIRNFFYIKGVIRKNKGTADWERFNLKVDFVNRIYTVFNPLPADKGDSPDVLEIKLGERMIPCHKYITDIGLSEVIAVSGEKIPNTDSYLVVYYPIFRYISTWKVMLNLFYLILLLILYPSIWKAINWVISLF